MNELLEFIKKHTKEYNSENTTTAERLRYRAFNETNTDSEWLLLENDIQEYMSSNPSESEKNILLSFCEMVGMRCSAIRLNQNV